MPRVDELAAVTALTDDDLLLAQDAPASTNVARKITAANARTYFQTPAVVTSSGTGAYTIDCSAGTVFDRTMTGNATLTLSNPTAGVPITLVLRQNATGAFTVTFSTTVKWMGQDPIWSGVASKISGTATLIFVASAWLGWWGGGEQ